MRWKGAIKGFKYYISLRLPEIFWMELKRENKRGINHKHCSINAAHPFLSVTHKAYRLHLNNPLYEKLSIHLHTRCKDNAGFIWKGIYMFPCTHSVKLKGLIKYKLRSKEIWGDILALRPSLGCGKTERGCSVTYNWSTIRRVFRLHVFF